MAKPLRDVIWLYGAVGICGGKAFVSLYDIGQDDRKPWQSASTGKTCLAGSPDRRHRVREKVWRENYVGAGEPSPHSE